MIKLIDILYIIIYCKKNRLTRTSNNKQILNWSNESNET